MDFGIISLGNHALYRVVPAILSSGSSVEVVYTRDKVKGEKFANEIGAEYTDDIDRAIHTDYDASYISSPNFLHFGHARKSLENGKAVLLEKPMTLKVEESEDLLKFSQTENIKMKIGFHLRFHPVFEDVKKLIYSSKIGEPKVAFGNWSRFSSHSNDRSWWNEPELVGGGSIVGTGVHVMDSFVNLFGNKVESVSAINSPRCAIIEKTMQVRILFESGIIANALSSREIDYQSNDLRVLGTNGAISALAVYESSVNSKLIVNGNIEKEYTQNTNMYEEEIKAFVKGDRKIASAEDGLLSTKMHLYSQKAACDGKVIKINEG